MQERIDEIGFGGYKLLQNPRHFCYGIDAVLLADFAKASMEDTIADLGTGTGVIPLILHHKSGAKHIVGVEKQETSYNLAVRNAEMNGLSDILNFFYLDVLDIKSHFKPGEFSIVVTNPPYTEKGTGPQSPFDAKKVARHETTAGLDDFIEAARYLLAPLGSFCIVHRPSRLVDLLFSCRLHGLEPKRLRFVSPKEGEPPNILLLQCIKDGGKELCVEPILYVRDTEGRYSPEIDFIYERSEK